MVACLALRSGICRFSLNIFISIDKHTIYINNLTQSIGLERKQYAYLVPLLNVEINYTNNDGYKLCHKYLN